MAAPTVPTAELRRLEWHGLPIVIETEAGQVREWERPDGSIGKTRIDLPYGYIEGYEGSDGDDLDCYVGRDPEAKFVHVVHQLAPNGKRDEDKCFLDVATAGAAESFFLQHRDDGDAAYGGMSTIPVEAFLGKLKRRIGSGKIRHSRGVTTMPVRSFHGITGADLRGYAGRVHAFDALDAGGKVRVGVWDRFATFGEGPEGTKVKEGEAVSFTPDTFAKMVDNWAARGQQLTMCLDHRSALGGLVEAPAAALYDAIAVVGEDGKTVHMKTVYGKTIPEPEAATLLDQCAKYPPPLNQPGGMWGYRSEITPKGAHPTEGLANFRGISPLFVMNGVDEQERPIGPVLFDVSAVNVNFQGGCELTLGALSAACMSAAESALHVPAPVGEKKPVAMADEGASIGAATDAQLANRVKRLGETGGIPSAEYTEIVAELKRRGINTFPQLQARSGVQFSAEGDFVPAAPAAVQPTTGGATGVVEGASNMDPSLMKRMGFADGANPSIEEKMAAYAKCAMGDATPDEVKAMAADLEASGDDKAKAMAKKMGDLLIEHKGEPDGDEVAKLAAAADLPAVGMSRVQILAGARERLVAMKATTVPREDVRALKEEISTLKARNAAADEAECEGTLVAFARGAIADGRWDPDGEEALVALARASVDVGKAGKAKAETGIKAAERHLKQKGFWKVMSNFTANGHPIGKGNKPEDFSSGHASASAAEVEYKAEIARVMETDKVSHAVAMSRVAKAKPELITALRK